MRLYEIICEKVTHDLSLTKMANDVANYLVSTYLPNAVATLKAGGTLTDGGDPDIEYAILGGHTAKHGYIAGMELDGPIQDYYFHVGKIKDLITKKGLDKAAYNAVKNIDLFLMPLPIAGSTSTQGTAFLNDNQIHLSMLHLLSKDKRQDLRNVIAHEMRHFLDNKMSAGNGMGNDEDDEEPESEEEKQKKHVDYLKQPHEGSARFTSAVGDLTDEIEKNPDMTSDEFKEVIKRLMLKHALVVTKDKKQARRFISRAWSIYREIKSTQ